MQKIPKESNYNPANICLFKVNNTNTRNMCWNKSCEVCSKLTIKTLFSSASIVDCEQVNVSWE